MGLLDTALDFGSNAIDSAGGFLDSLTGSLDLGFSVADTIKGALMNGVIAGVSGGDVAKSALWGGFGAAVGSTNLFKSYTNEVAGAIKGYGLDKSLGGSGLIGAAGGALYENSQDADGGVFGGIFSGNDGQIGSNSSTSPLEPRGQGGVLGEISADGSEAGIDEVTLGELKGMDSSTLDNVLKKAGITNENGTQTLAAKLGMGAVSGYLKNKSTQDVIKSNKEAREDELRKQKELYEFKKQQDQSAKVGLIGRL